MEKHQIYFTPYMVNFNNKPKEIRLVDRVPTPYERQYDLTTPMSSNEKTNTPAETTVTEPVVEETTSEWAINNPINGSNSDNLNAIAKRLQKEGFNKTQASAILATVIAESGGDPTAIGDNGSAHGIIQWHSPRWMGQSTLDSQIDLLINELRDRNNPNAWTGSSLYDKQTAFNIFNTSTDLQKVVQALTHNYIRPADKKGETTKRHVFAQSIFNQLA